MSIKLMAQVWTYEFDHGQQSVMLALADHANDDGEDCFPSIPLIAWKTGYSERQVSRVLQSLVRLGVLEVMAPATNRRPTEYAIRLHKATSKPPRSASRGVMVSPQAQSRGVMVSPPKDSRGDISSARGDICDARGDIAMSPEPSLETPIESSSSLAPAPAPVTATADDDDDSTLARPAIFTAGNGDATAMIAEALRGAGVAYGQILFEQYLDLAAQHGAPAVVQGIKAAVLNGHAHSFKYVAACTKTAAQGNGAGYKAAPVKLDFQADW